MSSGGGGSTTSTSINYSPEEAAERKYVMEEGRRVYDATGPTLAAAGYPGAKPVPYGDFTNAAMENLWGYSTGALPQNIQNAQNSLNFSLRDVLYPESNPALQGYMAAALRPIQEDYIGPTGAMAQLERNLLGPTGVMNQLRQSYTDPNGIMSQIRTQAGQEGQVGGSRQGIAEGMASRNYYQAMQDAAWKTTNAMQDTARKYINAMGDTSAQVANEGYGQGLTAMGRAQALAPGYAEMGTMPVTLQGQVGSMFDTQGQRFEDYNAAARMWDLNAPWTPLQNYASIVFGGASPGTSTTGTAQGPSTASKVAGAGMLGLGAYGGMMASGAAPLMAAAPYAAPLIAALSLF